MNKTLRAYEVRYLRKLLNYPLGGLSIDPEEARKGLEYLGPKKRSEKLKASRRAARAKEQSKRAARMEKSRLLYEAVFARPGWSCELGEHETILRVDLHHMKAGSAKRFYEAAENCVRACSRCHREWHVKGPAQFRAAVERLCQRFGYSMPSVYTRRAA